MLEHGEEEGAEHFQAIREQIAPHDAARFAASAQAVRAVHPLKNITRFEYGNTRGWWVRIRRKPAARSKLFSDGKYGGQAHALEAARAWRDEMLLCYPPEGTVASERRHKSTKTGVTGLYVAWPKRTRGAMPAVGISVIDQAGAHVVRSYSIRKWGLRKALWKACTELARRRASEQQRVLPLAQAYYGRAYQRLQGALAETIEAHEA